MEEFDYHLNKIIGYVEDNVRYPKIQVVGYCDFHNVFHTFKPSEIEELFPPQGKVFAHNFLMQYPELKGKLVYLNVNLNKSEGTDKDKYIWDKDEKVEKYGIKVSVIKGIFSEDGQWNYSILKKNNLLQPSEDKYVYSYEMIYAIKADNKERILKYWNEGSLKIITIHDKTFIVGNTMPKPDGMIDIIDDEQLTDWYISKVLKKNWKTFFKEQKFNFVGATVYDILLSLKSIDTNIIESRLKRLKAINTNLSITFDSLQDISDTPWFGDVVNRSVSKEKAQILEQIRKENNEELQNINEEYNRNLQRAKEQYEEDLAALKEKTKTEADLLIEEDKAIEAKIQERNVELEMQDETIKEKELAISQLEKSISILEERKDSVIQDYSVIREVLCGCNTAQPTYADMRKSFILEEVALFDKRIFKFKAYVKSLENTFKANNLSCNSPSTLGNMIAYYNVLLCPDIAIARIIILASKKCKYMTEYVSAKWTSFKDLWNEGLAYIVSQCCQDTDIMHFLILQNINISYLPNYMQPLIDLQREIISRFPETNIAFPKNLRILCTVAEDELIPLSKDILQHVGCIDNSDKAERYPVIRPCDDASIGYLTPEVLSRMRGVVIEEYENMNEFPKNFYESYLNE